MTDGGDEPFFYDRHAEGSVDATYEVVHFTNVRDFPLPYISLICLYAKLMDSVIFGVADQRPDVRTW